MIRTALGLALILFLQAQNAGSPLPVGPTAADLLRTALKAIEKADSIEYEVRRVAQDPGDPDAKLQTTILVTRAPFQFSAKTRDENQQVVQMAVSDGKTTRTSTAGKTAENPTFADDGKAMILANLANTDVAVTRQLFDPGYLNEASAGQRILLVGQSEIDGELCHVLVYARPSTRPDFFLTQYIWLSATSGLPRAVQNLNLSRGRSTLGARLVISKIQLNRAIPAATFAYRPDAVDSIAAPTKGPALKAPASVIGKPLPGLEVRGVDLKALRLTDFKGRPALITFWASWCGPCLKEMPTLQKLLDEYKGALQVLAIAVQEERRFSLQFIRDHPEFRFVFLTEPTPGERNTPLLAFFGIGGIPVGVFVDAQGRILDRWVGFDDEKEFVERIRRLMRR